VSDDPPRRPPSAEWLALGGTREHLDEMQDRVAQIVADVLGEELPLPRDRAEAIATKAAQRCRLPLANMSSAWLQAYVQRRRST
jgi:hypothetical protein